MCWGEVFAGGIGGLIARARPGLDPAPLTVRNGVLDRLQQLPPAPYVNATRYDVGDDEPLIADDVDVSHLASGLARLALDTLLDRSPSSFPYPAYLIGLRPEWIFSGAFDTQPIQIEGQGWNAEEPSEEDRNAAIASLIEMLKETTDDHADPPATDPGHDPNSTT